MHPCRHRLQAEAPRPLWGIQPPPPPPLRPYCQTNNEIGVVGGGEGSDDIGENEHERATTAIVQYAQAGRLV